MRADTETPRNEDLDESSQTAAPDEPQESTASDEEDDENIVFEMPPSASVVVLWACFWTVALVTAWHWGPQAILRLQNGSDILARSILIGTSQVAVATLIALGLTAVASLHILSLLMWRSSTRYVLTDEYFMVEKGVLGKKGWALPIDDIVEIKYERGILGIIGRFGSMHLKVRNQEKALDLQAVPAVAAATRVILATRSKYRRAHNPNAKKAGRKRPIAQPAIA